MKSQSYLTDLVEASSEMFTIRLVSSSKSPDAYSEHIHGTDTAPVKTTTTVLQVQFVVRN